MSVVSAADVIPPSAERESDSINAAIAALQPFVGNISGTTRTPLFWPTRELAPTLMILGQLKRKVTRRGKNYLLGIFELTLKGFCGDLTGQAPDPATHRPHADAAQQ
jgi:hypothetical protein